MRDGQQIARGHVLGLIGERRNAAIAFVQLLARRCVADLDERGAQRISPGMFSENQLPLGNADRFGGNNFVGQGIFQDAVLVDTGFVGERVCSYDGFVGRYLRARDLRQHSARRVKFVQMYVGRYAQCGLSHIQQYDYFLESRISGALADAVDRQFELAHAGLHRGQGIGHAQAQIVMAVRAERYALCAVQILDHAAEHGCVFLGHGVTDGVRQIDDCRRRV